MAEPDQLAKLHDIHLPEPISWWPMAPGWYFLIIFVAVFIALSIYIARRSYINGRAKRQALQLLGHYQEEHQRNANSQLTCMKISELLRRVALVYFPREKVAGLQGEAWLDFLTKTSKGIDFNALREYLLVLPYHPAKEIDLEALFGNARRWIQQRRRPCSN